MNRKTKIICGLSLLIACAFLLVSFSCFVKTYHEYEKQHDELLKKNAFSSTWALKCEREEQEEFNEKLHLGN